MNHLQGFLHEEPERDLKKRIPSRNPDVEVDEQASSSPGHSSGEQLRLMDILNAFPLLSSFVLFLSFVFFVVKPQSKDTWIPAFAGMTIKRAT